MLVSRHLSIQYMTPYWENQLLLKCSVMHVHVHTVIISMATNLNVKHKHKLYYDML